MSILNLLNMLDIMVPPAGVAKGIHDEEKERKIE